jgi:hypothetical protein
MLDLIGTVQQNLRLMKKITPIKSYQFEDEKITRIKSYQYEDELQRGIFPAVPGSNPASPQPTADCQSLGGLPPGMALGFGLTSVRGNKGENYEK